jgi:hypothetical protein
LLFALFTIYFGLNIRLLLLTDDLRGREIHAPAFHSVSFDDKRISLPAIYGKQEAKDPAAPRSFRQIQRMLALAVTVMIEYAKGMKTG